MRLVQLQHPGRGRRVAVVDDADLVLIEGFDSAYALAMRAAEGDDTLGDLVEAHRSDERLGYDAVYAGRGDWSLLPAFDHPEEPARCAITGTGLSHQKSAANRQAMHEAGGHGSEKSDSLKMYELGVAGGKPSPGTIGVQPEWFFKCNGTRLVAHNQPIQIPSFAIGAGEEAEPVAIYVVDSAGHPCRVGFAAGNEFSDHLLEEQNYLYLSSSKLRPCSLGPELTVGGAFDNVRGETRIERDGEVVWQADLATGEANMCHSLANLEHHHFKYPEHRRPGDVHLHFLGADAFSYSDRFELRDGDVVVIDYPDFGRPLRNPLRFDTTPTPLYSVRPL